MRNLKEKIFKEGKPKRQQQKPNLQAPGGTVLQPLQSQSGRVLTAVACSGCLCFGWLPSRGRVGLCSPCSSLQEDWRTGQSPPVRGLVWRNGLGLTQKASSSRNPELGEGGGLERLLRDSHQEKHSAKPKLTGLPAPSGLSTQLQALALPPGEARWVCLLNQCGGTGVSVVVLFLTLGFREERF